MSTQIITEKELFDFLSEANKYTYAADGEKVTSTRPQSEDFEYTKNNLTYHDTYFGERNFIGEEIVYKNNKPVWGMNYFGFILANNLSEKEIYNFLKESLRQKYLDIIPVRGGKNYESGDWTYKNNPQGGLDNFSGIEEIFLKNQVVYRCLYHGGYIK